MKAPSPALVAKRDAYLKQLSGYAPPESGGPDIVALDYAGADLFLYATSRAEKKVRALSCSKEPWTVGWLERVVEPGRIVYDIGANVGPYALVAAHRVGDGGHVYAFEPGYATFAHLCDNVVLNGYQGRITPLSIPLSARTGMARFAYHMLFPGHARHAGLEAGSLVGETAPAYEQPVPAMRLDDVVRLFGLAPPQVLKVDVDGAEVMVLDGAADTLRGPQLQHVLIEIDQQNDEAVLTVMQAAGFRLADRHHRVKDGVTLPFSYGVFVRA